MPPGKKQKPKSGQTRVTRREESQTARAGGGDEPSTSQEREDSGDEDTGRPNSQSRSQMSRINRSQRSSANTRASTTCPILTTRTRRREVA